MVHVRVDLARCVLVLIFIFVHILFLVYFAHGLGIGVVQLGLVGVLVLRERGGECVYGCGWGRTKGEEEGRK